MTKFYQVFIGLRIFPTKKISKANLKVTKSRIFKDRLIRFGWNILQDFSKTVFLI